MALTAGFALDVPPSPAEWRDMENTHLAWLRIAHVIANVPSDDCVTELAASMPDRATFAMGFAAAVSFFHEVAELASAAEIQFLDACVEVKSDDPQLPTSLALGEAAKIAHAASGVVNNSQFHGARAASRAAEATQGPAGRRRRLKHPFATPSARHRQS